MGTTHREMSANWDRVSRSLRCLRRPARYAVQLDVGAGVPSRDPALPPRNVHVM